MKIGIPKETKNGETRVALTPDAVGVLVKAGHNVTVQTGAGLNASFEDSMYVSVGCFLSDDATTLWQESDVIVKVKEPQVSEFKYLRKDLILVSYLHLAGEPVLTKAMLTSGITSFAYELYQDKNGQLPLLKPMSQVAGRLSVVVGAQLLLSIAGGKGILLGGASGVRRGKVTIVGAGTAGRAACELAIGQGAKVVVFEKSPRAIESIEAQFGNRVQVLASNPLLLEKELETTDLLIGAVLVPGAKAPHVIGRQHIKAMGKGSVFIDISIDQGGCGETSKVTTLTNPTFIEHGVLHYGVCNIPALVPQTSAQALSNAILPFVAEICGTQTNWSKEAKESMCTCEGLVPHASVRTALFDLY
jgi:alanine dehydrogenase